MESPNRDCSEELLKETENEELISKIGTCYNNSFNKETGDNTVLAAH